MKGLAIIRLHGLRAQVLIWTILPLIIFLIIFSLTGISTHQSSMRALVAEENTRLVLVMSNAISTQLDRYRVGLQTVAALEAQHPNDPEASQQHLNEISQIWGNFSLFLMNADGQIVTETTPAPSWITQAVNQLPMPSNHPAETFMTTTSDRQVIVWGVPLPENKGWLLGGVPVAALALDQLFDVEHPSAETTIALVDREGHILAGRGSLSGDSEARDWPGVSQALAGENGVLFVPTPNDEDIVTYAPVSDMDWVIVIREPWHALTAPLLRFEQAMPFILLIATVLSFLTLFFGLRYVVRPLHLLSVQVNRIGQGDFDAASQSVGGVIEIEDLRQSMNQMAHQLQRYQIALQDYLRAVTQAQEEERARLGRELHDETVQTLIALGHKAQMIQRTLERDPTQTADRVIELRQIIADAIEEVRRFSRALRPVYLEELGLVPALEILTREAGAVFQIATAPSRLKADKELALYRIAQESLNNARRHAKAQNMLLELNFVKPNVILRVSDDGIGFEVPPNLNELTRTGHFGLMGMRERTQLIGGQMTIISSPTQGTVITVTMPT